LRRFHAHSCSLRFCRRLCTSGFDSCGYLGSLPGGQSLGSLFSVVALAPDILGFPVETAFVIGSEKSSVAKFQLA
jgi:hypothetical protein